MAPAREPALDAIRRVIESNDEHRNRAKNTHYGDPIGS